MKSALADFECGIEQLVVFLNRNAREHELIGLLNSRRDELHDAERELLSQLVTASTNTKQYIYTVSIVSLYGVLERLVDNLVSSFVEKLGDISTQFSQLPEKIRENHVANSLALAETLIRDRLRTETTYENVIFNLHSCISSSDSYKLNGLAFAFHRGNVNLNRINEMLTGVGVAGHLKRISKTPSYATFLGDNNLLPRYLDLSDDALKGFFDPIDDLVARRNDVSHGVVQIDNLESINILKDRCAFVLMYGKSLYSILFNETLKFMSECGVALELGQPINVFDNRIVCFDAKGKFAVGDYVFAITQDPTEPVRSSKIMNLQVDGVAHNTIDCFDLTKFGAEVSFHAKKTYKYFFVASPNI